jgi:hypothetical protein
MMKVGMRLVWPGFDNSLRETQDIAVGYCDNCIDEYFPHTKSIAFLLYIF